MDNGLSRCTSPLCFRLILQTLKSQYHKKRNLVIKKKKKELVKIQSTCSSILSHSFSYFVQQVY